MSFNIDIDISLFKSVDKEIIDEINLEFYKKYIKIPNEFNWAINYYEDDEEIIFKKKLISPVKNQYLCGCCWAIAAVTALSDAYVIRNLVKWSPNISYTYALSKYPQNKCSGGSSRILLEEIKTGDGVASDYCVDESWCLNNPFCLSNDSSQHFTTLNKELISSFIPKEGCYYGNKKHYIYTIEDVYSLSVTDNLKINQTQNLIKQHIMIRGPVVAGFLILDNFPSGEFTKINSGIYFETLNKENFNIDNEKILGSHSVVVLGWGIAKKIKYKNIITDVPYWFCRNSWGDHWGDNGYFKIAMFPFNKICQFSKKIKVVHNNIIKEVGGVTGFYVNQKPQLKKLKTNMMKTTNLLKHLSYYIMDENLIVGNNLQQNSEITINNINKNNMKSLSMIITAIIICFIFLKNK